MKQFHQDADGRVSFGDGKEYARVVCDSIGPHGKRLVSVEAKYWRAIHSEMMTHRAFARNAASSRAIPFYRERNGIPVENCTYSMVAFGPFVPEFIGSEQKGMQSGDELVGEARWEAIRAIEEMWEACLKGSKRLAELGVHKSICNRYVEPWTYITTLITATEWANFFRLRCHPKAERHLDKVARLIREAIRRSEPKQLQEWQWHLPYIRDDDAGFSEDLCKVSAARCARLSYLTHDGKRDLAADLKLFDALINPTVEVDRDEDVIHASPLEHVAQCMIFPRKSGPFVGWYQLRKDYPRENVEGIGPLE